MKLIDFLSGHRVSKGEDFTHTSYGPPYGSYDIRGDDMINFLELYKGAFKGKERLHMTERHKAFSPCLIDIDFRQNTSTRQYDEEYIMMFIRAYTYVLSQYVKQDNLTIYVLEKPCPREHKQGYKDGLHIMIPDVITCPHIQEEIRRVILEKYDDLIKPSWATNLSSDIYDESVISRNNWFMYGSKKPDEVYSWEVTKAYRVENRVLRVLEVDASNPDLVSILSIRDGKNEESRYTELGKQIIKTPRIPETRSEVSQLTQYEPDIVGELVSLLSPDRADRYDTWIRVGWCLNNLDRNLLSVWVNFSKQSSKYVEGECVKLWSSMRDKGLNLGSLHRWAKEDSPTGYLSVMMKYKCEEDRVTIEDIRMNKLLCDYEYLKRVFERTHFKLMHPMSYVDSFPEVISRDETTLRKAYRNLYCIKKTETGSQREMFIDQWIKDPLIRTYQRMDFLPPPLVCDKGIYNMWKGFAIDMVDTTSSGNVDPFINHCRILAGNDDKCLDYFLKWLGHLIKEPGKLNGIALIFISKEGAGKNIFFNSLAKLIGEDLYYETADPQNTLFGRFSNARKNRLLIDLDEANGKDTLLNSEILKNMITSEYLNYEQKGVDPIKLRNFARLVFTTNNILCAKITDSTRRYVIFETSNEKIGDNKYFRDFASYMESTSNQKAIMEYLRTIDLSGINWILDRPLTETYKALKSICSDPILKFLGYLYNENKYSKDILKTTNDLYNEFMVYIKEKLRYKEEAGKVLTYRVFTLQLSKDYTTKSGLEKRDNIGPNYLKGYNIKLKDLRDYLISKDVLLEEEYMMVEEDDL